MNELNPVALPQDVEEFIADNAVEGDWHHAYIIVDELRAWMAGHVRVPVEPTPNMIRAGQIASLYWAASDSKENGLAPIYRAMLTASKESGK